MVVRQQLQIPAAGHHGVIDEIAGKALIQLLCVLAQAEIVVQQQPDLLRQKEMPHQIAQQQIPGLHTGGQAGAEIRIQQRLPGRRIPAAADVLINTVQLRLPAFRLGLRPAAFRGGGLTGQPERLLIGGAQRFKGLRVVLRIGGGKLFPVCRRDRSPVRRRLDAQNLPDLHTVHPLSVFCKAAVRQTNYIQYNALRGKNPSLPRGTQHAPAWRAGRGVLIRWQPGLRPAAAFYPDAFYPRSWR